MIEAPQPQGDQPSQYLPAGPPDPLIFEDFDGIDTATLRPGVDDKKAAWLDNFMPLAKRNLRTMYGLGAAVYTAAPNVTIVLFSLVNIRENSFLLSVLSDGSIAAVGAILSPRIIAPPGTITNPAITTVGIANYGNLYVLIVAKQTNGYFVWDGNGTTVFFPGDSVAGGTVPFAIGGTAIETYAGRVWIANGATITFSAPGSFLDFSSAHGGGNFTSTDSFLRVSFIQLKQSNGFLYLIADSSLNYISGVQTSGSPPITTFTNQNADPEAGSPWPASVGVFNRNILFANPFGAQISYGGAVTKISEALDGIYNTVPNFGNLSPSAAKAIIFGKKCWMLLLPIIDPISGQQVNKLLIWNSKIWWAATQEISLTFINTLEINSVLTAYGTDGRSVYPLFGQPSTTTTKIAQTKFWDKPGGYQFTKFVTRLWGIIKYYSSLSPAINVSIDNELGSNLLSISEAPSLGVWLTVAGAISTWLTASSQSASWTTGGGNAYTVFAPTSVGQSGVLTGFTVTTNAADLAIVSMMIHDEVAGYRG